MTSPWPISVVFFLEYIDKYRLMEAEMTQSSDEIREAVRDHYAQIARSADAVEGVPESCCGEADCGCGPVTLYDSAVIGELPVDITNLSLGCGDPLTIAQLQPGEVVLDLGSGAGMDCFLAANRVGEQGHVIGVDMTPEMLNKANANKARLGLENVEFRQGQIEALPVDDQSVDVVISNCVINLSPDKSAVFKEVFRVLKPGGRISISDIVTRGEFSPDHRAQLALWAECVTGAIDADEYIALVRDAGFVDVEVVEKVQASPELRPEGVPEVFSARIVGSKPSGGKA
jgi:arsenite methyltransferase